MNFRCKFRHHCSIPRPRFPHRVQHFSDLATASIDFCISYAESLPYFYFRFVWPTDLERILQASTPTAINFIKFEGDMTIAFLLQIHYVTSWSWPLTVWPWTVVIHGWSRDQPCHQFWRRYAYSFLSYNVSHWLPLKTRMRPLCMGRITWPVSKGSKTITYLESPTPICLFTIQLELLLGYDDD